LRKVATGVAITAKRFVSHRLDVRLLTASN
jgi:hypothetical protein